MANYPAETALETGVVPTARAAAASDTVPGGVVLMVINAGGSPTTVTITTPRTVGDLTVQDRTVSVTNGTTKMIAIPNNETYVDQSTGLVTLGISPTTSVTYYVIRDGLS